MEYNRNRAVAYARKWAHRRNPAYHNFDTLGGDCTNFVSQCLYAGCGMMNYEKDTGWYFTTIEDRAAAWTGVEFLHQFLTGDKDIGPYASVQPIKHAQPGDIIQFSFDGETFSHSLLVVANTPEILVASHTTDVFGRTLGSYTYKEARLLHIEGVRG